MQRQIRLEYDIVFLLYFFGYVSRVLDTTQSTSSAFQSTLNHTKRYECVSYHIPRELC